MPDVFANPLKAHGECRPSHGGHTLHKGRFRYGILQVVVQGKAGASLDCVVVGAARYGGNKANACGYGIYGIWCHISVTEMDGGATSSPRSRRKR